MLWLFFALLSPLLWATSNLMDGDIVFHRMRKPMVLMGTTGLFSGLPALFLILTGNFSVPSLSVILFGLATGMVGLVVYYPYFRALETASPAEVVLLWNLGPVLVTIGAYFLLDERLTVLKYVAIALLILSTVVIQGTRESFLKLKVNKKAALWMVLASVGLAIQGLMDKRLFQDTSTVNGLTLISVGSFALGLVLFFSQRERRNVELAFKKFGPLLITDHLFDLGGILTFYIAVALGSVSLTMAIGGIQALIIVALTWIGSRIFTKQQFRILKPPPAWRVALAVVLTVVGMALV